MTDPEVGEAISYVICIILFVVCVGYAADSGLAAAAAFFLTSIIAHTVRAYSKK